MVRVALKEQVEAKVSQLSGWSDAQEQLERLARLRPLVAQQHRHFEQNITTAVGTKASPG